MCGGIKAAWPWGGLALDQPARGCLAGFAGSAASRSTGRAVSAALLAPRQLSPFDSVYINRLLEAFEMAGTNVRHMQTILDAILDGT